MTGQPPLQDAEDDSGLDLVRGDALWRLQRALGLIPRQGLGVVRRALGLAIVTWLPIATWALYMGRATGVEVPEPLLKHFGIHARFLIAVPLMIVAEGVVHSVMPRVIPYFVTSGVLPPSEVGRFKEIIARTLRLRDNTLPWIFILGIVVALSVGSAGFSGSHELEWARDTPTHLGFGGKWFLFVGRPIFLALLFGWIWRVILFAILLRRISRLPLALVASHPDGNGGLGFLELLPVMFSPIVFALSSLLASAWSHRVLYHGIKVLDLKFEMIAFAVVLLIIFLGPLFVFLQPIRKAKRAAELEYGALVGHHGRMVRQRWIEGKDVADERGLLGAPELGPVADHIAMFQAVDRMRAIPIGKRALMSILVPAAIPMLVVISLQIPIKDLLLGLVKAIA